MATIVKCSSQIQMHNVGSKKDLKVKVALESKQAAVTIILFLKQVLWERQAAL